MTKKRAFNREIFARLWCDHSITTQRIADAMGISRSGVSWHAHNMGLPTRAKRRYRKHDPELLREMWIAGVSGEEIARHFGFSHRACVSVARRKLGLPARKRGKSGKYNGGWVANITLAEFAEIRLAERMKSDAQKARRDQKAA